MPRKPWQLNRRTFLRGAGVCAAVPYLEAMRWGERAGESGAPGAGRASSRIPPFAAAPILASSGAVKNGAGDKTLLNDAGPPINEATNWVPTEMGTGRMYHGRATAAREVVGFAAAALWGAT